VVCLRTGVRKNALMVLTHLILNDMMKVKGHIARMAMCLQVHLPILIGRKVGNIRSKLFTRIYRHTSMQQPKT
jgi:non-SMC mitotic condensation complex subunit 1